MSAGGSLGEIIKSLVVNVTDRVREGRRGGDLGLRRDARRDAALVRRLRQPDPAAASASGRRSKPADAKHPLGYGRAMYFYSFIVALLLFFGGGVFSIHEGIHKILHPEPVDDIGIALVHPGVLARARGLVDARQHPGDQPAARRQRRSSATCATPRTRI